MMNMPDFDETRLADGYEDCCILLQQLDKLIDSEGYQLTDDDDTVRVRWALANFIHDYDHGEALAYGDYLALVVRAQDVLEGEND